ncbi:cell division cycle-associated 7-like protein [Schistocerca nitens]|uniref:cell division cycle-associated 7-like protein n=1 Tax=Schistocerca nitens TaxID=7011 RepID=UPI0021190AD0|nr:cell division cycle-associated 7-like protein [Schistocerca nitens]
MASNVGVSSIDVANTDPESLKLMLSSIMKEAREKAEELNRKNSKKGIKRGARTEYIFKRDQKFILNPRRSTRLSGRCSSTGSEVDIDTNDSESDTERKPVFKMRIKRRHTISVAPPPKAIPVEEVTDEMIERIHKYGMKEYNSVHGVLCHQCRQKTMDTKTMCRSSRCVGGQGSFCGPCLSNHYGESVAEALRDPEWTCPPCRNVCICSVHMKMRGMQPAGQLTPIARSLGYKSVLDYLVAKEEIKIGDEGIIVESE